MPDLNPAGLDLLLKQLKFDGIPIGFEETLRLKHVFSLEPRADRDTLFNLLASTLCKSRQQRRIFADDFDFWFENAKKILEPDDDQSAFGIKIPDQRSTASQAQSAPDSPEAERTKKHQEASEAGQPRENLSTRAKRGLARIPAWLYLSVVCALLIAIGIWNWNAEQVQAPPEIHVPTIAPPLPNPDKPKQLNYSPSYWTWLPEVRLITDPTSERIRQSLIGVVLLALLIAAITAMRFYARIMGVATI